MPSTLTREEVEKIDWVQNISGGPLILHDFSEDGKSSLTLEKDEKISVNMYLSMTAKTRCRSLVTAIVGIPTGIGNEKRPLLRRLDGPDSRAVKTEVKGTVYSNQEDLWQADKEKNYLDLQLEREKLKQMKHNYETMSSEDKKEELAEIIKKKEEKIIAAENKLKTTTAVVTEVAEGQDKEVKDPNPEAPNAGDGTEEF